MGSKKKPKDVKLLDLFIGDSTYRLSAMGHMTWLKENHFFKPLARLEVA